MPIVSILLLGLSACDKDEALKNKGLLRLNMEVDTTAISSGVITKAAGDEFAVFQQTDDYRVEILKGTTVVNTWERLDKMPDDVELEAGSYQLKVSKGSTEAGAFEAPYFAGTQKFTIEKEMTTKVTATAALANCKASVTYADDFLQTYQSYTLSFKTAKMTTPLVYEKGESRSIYFQCDSAGTKLEIGMELVDIYGKEKTYNTSYTIKSKQWAKFNIRTDEKGLNGIILEVVLNDETKETIHVNIGIPDFMEKLKGAPFLDSDVLKWEGNETIDEPTILGPSNMGSVSENPIPINITAGGKIGKLILSLSQQDQTIASYDLANLSAAQQKELLNIYKLEIDPKNIKEKIQTTLDLKPFVNALVGAVTDSEYLITLLTQDALPKPNTTTRTLKVKLNKVEAPVISGLNNVEFKEGEYTGDDQKIEIESLARLKSLIIKSKGLNLNADIVNGSKGNIQYEPSTSTTQTITLTKDWYNSLPIGDHTIVLDIENQIGQKATGTSSFTVKVNPPTFEWAMADNDGDIFAKHALLRVKAKDASKVAFYQNGSSISVDFMGKETKTGVMTFVWKGLSSNTQYSGITAKYDEDRELITISFKTETEVYLGDNGKLEEWTAEGGEGHGDVNADGFLGAVTGYSHEPYRSWEKWIVENGYWSTLNSKTTESGNTRQDGPKLSNALKDRKWTRYVANSGTIKTDGHNGGNAALIRTVGWGEGNNASSIGRQCNNITPGELYLGEYNNEILTGIDFESRPSGISFYYKYTPKNSNDFFVTSIILYNENGLKIGEYTYNSTPNDVKTDWTEKILKINNYQGMKAAKMSILFKSSGNSDCWSLSKDNLNYPPDANLTTGEYVGSQLYIDDVELIYE